jgi:integrase
MSPKPWGAVCGKTVAAKKPGTSLSRSMLRLPKAPSVAQRYGARLPQHLTPEQVETLLKAIRTDGPLGRRNYAMVLLIARLGLCGLKPPVPYGSGANFIKCMFLSGEKLCRF